MGQHSGFCHFGYGGVTVVFAFLRKSCCRNPEGPLALELNLRWMPSELPYRLIFQLVAADRLTVSSPIWLLIAFESLSNLVMCRQYPQTSSLATPHRVAGDRVEHILLGILPLQNEFLQPLVTFEMHEFCPSVLLWRRQWTSLLCCFCLHCLYREGVQLEIKYTNIQICSWHAWARAMLCSPHVFFSVCLSKRDCVVTACFCLFCNCPRIFLLSEFSSVCLQQYPLLWTVGQGKGGGLLVQCRAENIVNAPSS